MNGKPHQNGRSHIGLKQDKSLGQVFLKSPLSLAPITAQLRDFGVKSILEIGPGSGILTEEILRLDAKVTCVEFDHRYALMLQLRNRPQLSVVECDFLKYPVEDWISSTDCPRAIVGNIPYGISTPILLKTLPHLHDLKCLILMTQKEFAQRLAAQPETSHYGSLSVYTQLRCCVSHLGDVDRFQFKPIPKVDSSIVCLTNRKSQWTQEQLQNAEKISRHVFQQRRKKLSNSLKPFLSERKLEHLTFDLNSRPDALNPEDFLQLGDVIFGRPQI